MWIKIQDTAAIFLLSKFDTAAAKVWGCLQAFSQRSELSSDVEPGFATLPAIKADAAMLAVGAWG